MAPPGSFLRRSRHGSVFYFFRRVPRDIRERLGRQSIYRSLATTNKIVAVRLARMLATSSDTLFDELRRMNRDPSDGTDSDSLDNPEWGSWGISKTEPTRAPIRGQPVQAKQFLPAIRQQGAPDSATVGESLPRIELTIVAKPGPDGLEFHIDTQPGADGDTPEQIRAAIDGIAAIQERPRSEFNPGQALPPPSGLTQHTSRTIVEAIDAFLAHAKAKNAPDTVDSYRRSLTNSFQRYVGKNFLVSDMSQRKLAEYAAQVHERQAKGLATSTRNQRIGVVVTLFKWLKAQGETQIELSSDYLTQPTGISEDAERDAFTLDQLQILFNEAAHYRVRTPEIFWATVGSAFLGCRLEELAQVDVTTDLSQVSDGTWVLSIDRKPDPDGKIRKGVKTSASVRMIPVHSALVRAGFIEFFQGCKTNPNRRPFERWKKPLISSNDIQFSHAISKWGGHRLKRIAEAYNWSVRGRLTYFHSMRHSLATHLRSKGVSEAIRSDLMGHTVQGAGINESRYGKPMLENMVAAVEEHMGEYVTMLNTALALEIANPKKARETRRAKSSSLKRGSSRNSG